MMYFKDAHGSNMAQNGQWLSEHRRESNRKGRHLPKGGHREGHSESRRCPLVGRRSPLTLRQAVSRLGITEENPLEPLKNLNSLEVIEK